MIPGEHESFGAALRRLRHERGVSSLRQFADAVHYSAAYISEVERGVKRPTLEVARKCDDALRANGLLVARAEVERLEPGKAYAAAVEPPAPPSPVGVVEQPVTVQEMATTAANESTSGAADDGSRAVPAMSVEQVQDDARRLAQMFNDVAPLTTLVAARKLRDAARRMAEQTNRPSQSVDLYQVAGQACGIMSMASFHLAIWPAATEQARATLVYGDLVDDHSLQAWALGSLALTAYWTGHPREAVDYADRGLRIAPQGTARARLLCIAARAWSYLGDAQRAAAAIEAADQERQFIGEASDDALHDETGGEFGWGPARHAACDATSWLHLGEADRAAESARAAIQLRAHDDTGQLIDTRAAIDLAAAELLRDNLDAVEDVLSPVWDVPADYRGHSLVARLADVSVHLSAERYRQAPEARSLTARIDAFTRNSAPRALPPPNDQFA